MRIWLWNSVCQNVLLHSMQINNPIFASHLVVRVPFLMMLWEFVIHAPKIVNLAHPPKLRVALFAKQVFILMVPLVRFRAAKPYSQILKQDLVRSISLIKYKKSYHRSRKLPQIIKKHNSFCSNFLNPLISIVSNKTLSYQSAAW
jgi:hypothetical protein